MSMDARLDFISAAPRPVSIPSFTVGSKGGLCQLLSGPEGTTSVCPAKQSIGPEHTKDVKKIETVGEIDLEFASKIKKLMGTTGSLSSGVYFHALMIAKKSIVEKPFGWGVNRYDKAFEYFNKKNPPKIPSLSWYNNRDGTNNLVKLFTEFGFLALILYLFFFLFLINKNIPLEYKLFYLPFVVTQSLRGAGYFNSGFSLIVFFMLFTYLKLNKKNL